MSSTSIFTVQARDRDGVPFNEVEYAIRAGGRQDQFFALNSTTGEVYLQKEVDRYVFLGEYKKSSNLNLPNLNSLNELTCRFTTHRMDSYD